MACFLGGHAGLGMSLVSGLLAFCLSFSRASFYFWRIEGEHSGLDKKRDDQYLLSVFLLSSGLYALMRLRRRKQHGKEVLLFVWPLRLNWVFARVAGSNGSLPFV